MGFYARTYNAFVKAIRWFFHMRITGAENEPLEGGYIIAANHLSDADVVVLAASVKRQVRYLAKAELFKIPLLAPFIRALGAFPVDRKKTDVGAIKVTLSLLEQGEVVGIYPQGTRYKGVLPITTKEKIKSGIGMIAYRAKVPVLPVYIQTKKYRIVPFRKIKVTIGKPISQDEMAFTSNTREDYQRVSSLIFERICSMATED